MVGRLAVLNHYHLLLKIQDWIKAGYLNAAMERRKQLEDLNGNMLNISDK